MRLHNAWNAAVSLRAPLFAFGNGEKDRKRVPLTLKAGARTRTG